MEDLTEIRWHGRGGQGAKTASQLVADAALEEDMYIQAFAEYGPERMGAPIQSFTRLSKNPIKIHCHAQSPDVVIVLDPTLISSEDVTSGMKENGILLINTDKSPSEIRNQLSETAIKVYTVDASGIAQATIGRPIPNTPMIGALTKITGLIKIEKLKGGLRKKFSGKFKDEIVEGNIKAVERAYEEVKSE
jgi:pyruvate ferredoxin oxidoreductase gamma subunit